MTTIVYDHKNKQIAVDGRINADGVVLTDDAIKYREENGETWFFTGSCSDEEYLMALNHNDKPEVKPDSSAIMVKDSKCYLVTFNGDYCAHTELSYSHSIGSGWKFGLSALSFNCNAEKAVAFAAEKDVYTGGKITVFDVENMAFVE